MDVRTKRVHDDCHQRRSSDNHRGEEINKAGRFVGNNVFLENEFEKIGQRLQESTGAHAIGPQAALNKSEHTPLCQHRVRHHRHNDGKGDQDADDEKCEMFQIFHSVLERISFTPSFSWAT